MATNQNTQQFDIFLRGEQIDLVVLNQEIVETTDWYKWFNDELNTMRMQQHYFPNSQAAQLKYLEESINGSRTRIQLGIVKKDCNIFCGVTSLEGLDFINRNASVSLIIGEASCRDLHTAYEAIKLMLIHGFFTLNLHKIHAGYIETLDAWGTFLKNTFNFTHEGIQKEHVFKDGQYLDLIHLGLTIDAYQKKKN